MDRTGPDSDLNAKLAKGLGREDDRRKAQMNVDT
jgi:hypothetical protein